MSGSGMDPSPTGVPCARSAPRLGLLGGSRLVTIPSGDNLGNSVRLAVDVDYRDRDGLAAAGEEADRRPRCLHLDVVGAIFDTVPSRADRAGRVVIPLMAEGLPQPQEWEEVYGLWNVARGN